MCYKIRRAGLALVLAAAAPSFAAEQSGAAAAQPKIDMSAPMVTVGPTVVTTGEFIQALQNAMRQKYYHGKARPEQIAELQKNVADDIADRILLLEEARARGLAADQEKIAQTLKGYDERYKGNARYEATREQTHAAIRSSLEQQDLLAQLEKKEKAVPKPSEADARGFYKANPELFTEPEKNKVSFILLKVDPSAGSQAWRERQTEAEALYKRLKKGESFAEIAKKHSEDKSASEGGDLGYLHKGMLPADVQKKLDEVKPVALLEPMFILEGVAIFRLDGRTESSLRRFEDVKERAADLLHRQRAEEAWKGLIARLRSEHPVRIESGRFAQINALFGASQ